MNWANWTAAKLVHLLKPSALAAIGVEDAATLPVRCISPSPWAGGKELFYQRHLYLGGEFCKRGCGHKNPKPKGGEAA